MPETKTKFPCARDAEAPLAVQPVCDPEQARGLDHQTSLAQPRVRTSTSPPAPLPEKAAAWSLTADAMMPVLASHAYIQKFMGNDLKIEPLFAALSETVTQTKNGDLSNLEAMLATQATTLQAIFTSLALRAAPLADIRQHEGWLSLAFKAQAQSRATIQALVDLKYPRNATFVKQANIANGAQQVNNAPEPAVARVRKKMRPGRSN